VATFSDANTAAPVSDFTATVTWGDGTSSAGTVAALGGGAFLVLASHTYADDGTKTLSVAVHDDGGSSVSGSVTLTVADAALGNLVVNSPGSAVEGKGTGTFTVATFRDANAAASAADFTASISWGDGSSSGTIVALGGGAFAVQGSHTYAEEGAKTLSVQVHDKGGSSLSGGVGAAVADAPLGSLSIHSPSATAGVSTGTFTVAAFTDGSTAAPVSDFTAVIAWGDGSASAVSGSGIVSEGGGNFAVRAAHTYAAAGTFTLSVHVTDVGGSSVSGSGTVTVASAGNRGFPVNGSVPVASLLASLTPPGSPPSPQIEQQLLDLLMELYILETFSGL
jgi:hypothetical protein